MPRLQLSLACWDYDRTRALADGSVRPEGIDLVYQNLFVEETFFRMLRNREFDAAEMSLSSYCVSLMREEPAFVAIPVFPSRFFRHSCIFVSAKSGIREPKDLAGKKTGVPEYQMTAPVWIRGILQDEYGVDPASCEYWTGGEEEPGRDEKLELELPAKFRLKSIGPKQTLAQMISDGELDAMHTARTPSTFAARPGTVRRLFEDYVEVEKAYYRKTKIFPIMHTVVVRRELYQANRWIAPGAAQDLRNPRHHHGANHNAALAGRACRGSAAGARRGLVALRLRAQSPRARDVPALSPRAGAIEAAAESGGAFRAGDAQVFPGLISCSAVRNPIGK